jgi:hypothetical protein
MRAVIGVSLALITCLPAAAGELVFANGSRLDGELSNETLMVSTGGGLVEIAADEVVALSRDDVRLRDGRVVRGTLVGGQIKARTALGEIAVKVDELQSYRASAAPTDTAATAAPAPATATARAAQPVSAPAGVPAATPAVVSGPRSATGITGGLPTVAAYPDARAPGSPAPGVQVASLNSGAAQPAPGRMLEVVGDSAVYRDALFGSSRVGHVAAGEHVTFVDAIDRRLRILNLLVFDGGYWVKIRVPDGTEGWVPADTLREVR